MVAQSMPAGRFVRRTQLGPDEYRKNFRQLDCEIIAAVTSPEADAITSLMSKVYLRLANAPEELWEREGVLRFVGGEKDGRRVTAWEQLVSLVGVSSATARKALTWMHEEGVVGYHSGKNGVGIRIFLNRAASSIGSRRGPSQKNLRLVRASNDGVRTSKGDTPFKDSFAVLEVSETDSNPRAPKDGAETMSVVEAPPESPRPTSAVTYAPRNPEEREPAALRPAYDTVSVEEMVGRLRGELEPCVREVAARAAAQSAAREMERTREWFETKALPKAVRVAQRETFDLLRKHGGLDGRGQASAGSGVGRGAGGHTAAEARPLTAEEIRETAEVCVALLEAQGKSIEVTLSELSSRGGGWLLPDDAPRVREAARELALSRGKGGS